VDLSKEEQVKHKEHHPHYGNSRILTPLLCLFCLESKGGEALIGRLLDYLSGAGVYLHEVGAYIHIQLVLTSRLIFQSLQKGPSSPHIVQRKRVTGCG